MSDNADDQTDDELTLGEIETTTEAGDHKAKAALDQRPGHPLTTHEHEVLTDWLNHDSPHASGLRQQLQLGVLAESSCDCGCGSISLLLTNEASRHRVDISGPYPIKALLTDPLNPGGMILFLKDGLLDDIDVFSVGEQPAQFPSPGEVHFGGP